MGGRTEGMIYSFYSILPTLIDSPSAVFSQGFMQFIPYGILLLLFAFCTFLPSVLQQRGTNNPLEESNSYHDGYYVPLYVVAWFGHLLLVYCYSGLLLQFSAFFSRLFQRVCLCARMKLVVAEDTTPKPVEVDVVRKTKKKRPTKKSK